MPSGFSSMFHVGAKTWRPKPAEQQFLEADQRRLAREEETKRAEVQRKIETLEQIRKLEARTQALDDLALQAELRAKEHEISMRERQLAGEKQRELAKLELAKRHGQDSLSEADLARIRRDRLKAELIARAAENHAAKENHRPISGIDLGPVHTPLPPPPPKLHRMPTQTPHAVPPMTFPVSPRPPVHGLSHAVPPISHTPLVGPIHIPLTPHIHDLPGNHRLAPELPIRHRRLSDSRAAPPGIARGQWGLPGNSLRVSNPSATPLVTGHAHRFDRPDQFARRRQLLSLNDKLRTEYALRAQAEKIRRSRLLTLDLKARKLDLRAQALRDLRKRELVNKLRERGIQQREIETEVRLLAERDRNLNEAQLREIRDREHKIMLQEKGLQEREIADHIRRREERDREILRDELDKLEKELRRKELLEAELSIKRAMEKGEAPPMGIARPSIEEIETEGLLADDFWNEFEELNPRLRHEILSESGMTAEYRPRTPGGGFNSSGSLNSRAPNSDHLSFSKTPIMGEQRTPLMRASSPGVALGISQAHDIIRDEQARVSEENRLREEILSSASRAATPRMRDEIMRSMTPRTQDRLHVRAGSTVGTSTPRLRGEEMLGDTLPHHQLGGRPRSQSFGRTPSSSVVNTPRLQNEFRGRGEPRDLMRQGSRNELDRDAELAEAKAKETQRMRDELRAREENNRMNPELSHRLSLGTPIESAYQRSPAFRDNFDSSFDNLGHRLDVPQRSSSRASSRGYDYDAVPCYLDGTRDGQVPLGLPSRPSSRNFTAEDLGLEYPERERERLPGLNNSNHDELLAARLHSAALNSEINGGRRSRANSRVDPADQELFRSAHSQMGQDFDHETAFSGRPGRRSRANSRAGRPDEGLLSPSKSQMGSELPGRRSRANSQAQLPNLDLPRSASRNQLVSELNPVSAGGRSRAGSFNQPTGRDFSSRALLDGPSRSPLGDELAHSVLQEEALRGKTSRPPSRFSAPSNTLKGLSDGEISRMTTEQLEMMLSSEVASRPFFSDDSLMGSLTKEDIDRMSPRQLDALLAAHETEGMTNSLRNFDMGMSQNRSISRRPSRAVLGDSPPFGSEKSHSLLGPNVTDHSRSGSRGGIATGRHFGEPLSQGSISKYENISRPSSSSTSFSPNAPLSLYNMPGYYDARESHQGGDKTMLSTGEDDCDLDVGDFSITECPEQPGTRIIKRLGTVQADSNNFNSNSLSRSDELSDRDEMHRAVKNLIAEASRRGANGIVLLRVSDMPDGSYNATGEAVVLAQ
ncbi:hypothetical protein BY996DRAFT_4578888 [Phakopsora pachyrhizi]|nr:hypothetical protein BY996DRAFT_4578888 [Phakopsora pachyrhizi]